VSQLLVLWDVDYTLIDAGRVGRMLYDTTFREMFGVPPPEPADLSGRTDTAIALEVLGLAGLAEPRDHLVAFQAALGANAPALTEEVRRRARALPGAAGALAAVAALNNPGLNDPGLDGPGRLVVQSLLTGNIRPLAEVKLGPLGLLTHLDLDAGAYGDSHEIRGELVHVARRNAARGYGADFSGPATVLIGDTPLDVEAALTTGARAVGVATGRFSVDELAAAGAHVVLPDLRSTATVVEAIVGAG
jgi:phosphoglycolate phosphatase